MKTAKHWLVLLVLLSLPVVLLAAPEPQISWEQDGDDWKAVIEYTFEPQAGQLFKIEHFLGSMTIEAGDPLLTIAFHANDVDFAEAEALLEKEIPELTRDDAGYLLRGESQNSKGEWSFDLEVFLPAKQSVHASTAAGGVELDGLTGEFSISTGAGSINFENITGDIEASTGGGSIEGDHVNGNLDLSTGGGGIELSHVTGSLVDASTGGGGSEMTHSACDRIDLSTGGGALYLEEVVATVKVDVSTGGGDINIRGCKGVFEASTGAGAIDVESHTGKLDISTGAGRVDVDESICSLVASTGMGSLDVELLGFDDIENPIIELSSGMGSVTLALPGDGGYDFDLSTGSSGKISSEFAIDINKDKSHGSGSVNGGGVDVEVTTQGKIKVKKI